MQWISADCGKCCSSVMNPAGDPSSRAAQVGSLAAAAMYARVDDSIPNHCGTDRRIGSQKAEAGTRQRRFSKLSFQNFVWALSSRVLVTRFGA